MKSPLNPHPFSPAPPVSNDRRAQPRRTRSGGEWVIATLSVLGGLIAIAVVALVLL
jgi:hypothetical protein